VVSNQPYTMTFGELSGPGLSSDKASVGIPALQPPFLHVIGCTCSPLVPGVSSPADSTKSTPMKSATVQPRFGSPLTGTRSSGGTSAGSSTAQQHALKTGCAACRVGPGSMTDVSVLVRRVDLSAVANSLSRKAPGAGLSAQKQQELFRRQVTMLKGQHQGTAVVVPPEIEAAQKVLMLTFNTLTGGIGRMMPASEHMTPAVLSALRAPTVSLALTAVPDVALPVDESVGNAVLAAAGSNAVLVRTLLDHWVTLTMTFTCDVGGATATDLKLRAVSTRDLKHMWTFPSRIERSDAPFSELDDFIVDNWTQGDEVTV
jgi:hypothetical protein